MNPIMATTLPTAGRRSEPVAATVPGHRLRLGDAVAQLDRGGILVAQWAGAAALEARVQALGQLASPVVRMAGGALIGDLSLRGNLMLEPALAGGVLPTGLLSEIDALFTRCGCAIDWLAWSAATSQQASPEAMMQVRTGRALVADADVLLIDAAQWDDAVLSPEQFSRSFAAQYPWRVLVWATCDPSRAEGLRTRLQELLT
jgi:hypothetical protein